VTALQNQPVVQGDRSLLSESGIALIISLMAMLFMMCSLDWVLRCLHGHRVPVEVAIGRWS